MYRWYLDCYTQWKESSLNLLLIYLFVFVIKWKQTGLQVCRYMICIVNFMTSKYTNHSIFTCHESTADTNHNISNCLATSLLFVAIYEFKWASVFIMNNMCTYICGYVHSLIIETRVHENWVGTSGFQLSLMLLAWTPV